MLGPDLARLTLAGPLPLHAGERVLLRDPGAAGSHGLTGAVVLDVVPPPVGRRGAAAAAAAELRRWPDLPTAADVLRRHKIIRSADARAMGLAGLPAEVAPGWLADPEQLTELRSALAGLVAAHAARHPLAAGMPVDAARAALRLPDKEIMRAIIVLPLKVTAGLITAAREGEPSEAAALPASLAAPVASVLADLAAAPFSAPDAVRLRELGLDNRALATAARLGALLRIADQIVLAPGADVAAGQVLADLPQPFTAAQARQALGTTRRTLIPLLEHLDRQRITRRLPDDRREVRK
jgi:selenocysteine-specific elongation factor